MEHEKKPKEFISAAIDEIIFKNFNYILTHSDEEIFSVFDDEKGPAVMFSKQELLQHQFPEIAVSQLREILTRLQERKCLTSNTQLDPKTQN